MEKEQALQSALFERVNQKKLAHHGRVADVEEWDVTLPDGRPAKREIIVHPGAAAVLPLDAEGNVTMVYQFRHPLGRVTLEIPAGKKEQGEKHLTCAVRELREEVGLLAQKMTLLTELATSPGIFNEQIAIYLATGLTSCSTDPDEDEFLNVRKFPLSQLAEMVLRGEIRDSKTIVAIMLTWEKQKRGEI